MELMMRPVPGGKSRDVELRLLAVATQGSAPVAAGLATVTTSSIPVGGSGKLTTTSFVAGVHLDVPLARGLFVTTGAELQLARVSIAPSGDAPPAMTLIQTISAGLTGVLSTDRAELLRPTAFEPDERANTLDVAAEDVDAKPKPRDSGSAAPGGVDELREGRPLPPK
jgi:hypothetical protein